MTLSMKTLLVFFSYCCSASVVVGFTTAANPTNFSPASGKTSSIGMTATGDRGAVKAGSSMAKYLVDMSDAKETFDFCGGMMFQLVLTDALKEHLLSSPADSNDVTVYENTPRMHMTPGYHRAADADNARCFHGREIRNVPTAAGGMGMVLQLSLAADADNGKDPEGWTPQEVARYDGWGHDAGREWRKGPQLVEEGFANFRDKFGPSAYALHHRFYLHKDPGGNLWLAAEDGCQGTPKQAGNNVLSNLFGFLK